MNSILQFVTAAILISLMTLGAQARVTVSEKTKYFSVSGKTGKQIYQQLRRRAPAKLRRKNWIAATYANLNFKNIKIGVKGKRCLLTRADIHLSLTYHYPKLRSVKSKSKNVRKHWKAFSRGLVVHEKTHGRIFHDMAKSIIRVARAVSGNSSDNCRRFTRTLKRKFREIEKKFDRKQDAFDRRDNRSTSKFSKIEREFVRAR